MAKLALIKREQKRRDTVDKFAGKRKELLAVINNSKASPEDRHEARLKFQALPRNSMGKVQKALLRETYKDSFG